MKITKEVSNTLAIANLIATCFVIAIHYNSKNSIESLMGYNWNYLLQDFFTNGVARVAVPFFATMSGFFLMSKIGDFPQDLKMLKNRATTLLIPYILSSILIFLGWAVLTTRSLESAAENFNFYSIAIRATIAPISIQFWFLRDLIILTVISPLILNNQKIISYILGVFLFLLWILNIQPFPIVNEWYLINIETLFFFWFGGIIFRYQSTLESLVKSSTRAKIFSVIVWFSAIAIRIYLDPGLNVWYVSDYKIESILLYKTAILLGIISLIQVSALMKNNNKLIYLSGFTFFAYLFHFIPLSYFTILTGRIVNESLSFYLNFPIATFLVFSIGYFTYKYFPKFYLLITGGRSPDKSLQRRRSLN